MLRNLIVQMHFFREEYWEKSGDKSDRRNYTENGCRLVLRVLRPILPQTRILSGRPHLPFLPLYICNCTTWGGNRKIGYFCEIHQFQIFSTSACFAGSALFYFLYGRGDLFSTRLLQLNWRLEITISSLYKSQTEYEEKWSGFSVLEQEEQEKQEEEEQEEDWGDFDKTYVTQILERGANPSSYWWVSYGWAWRRILWVCIAMFCRQQLLLLKVSFPIPISYTNINRGKYMQQETRAKLRMRRSGLLWVCIGMFCRQQQLLQFELKASWDKIESTADKQPSGDMYYPTTLI